MYQSEQSDQDQVDQLMHSAALGQQIESFLRSDVGKYLHDRASRVYNAAVEDFKRVNPNDVAAVMRCQADMWKAEAFIGWLSQGIQEGLTSLGILQGIEDDPETS
jgi:hypothetical protein